jgi:hypothetical protein
MKISREDGKKVFKPFTMLITFEEEWELEELFLCTSKINLPSSYSIRSKLLEGINKFLESQK